MLCTKKINGIEIGYEESGVAEGPPIVLLTGWAHDISLYDPLIPYLAPEHWVIRISWRGHGPSRDPIEDFGIDEQISDTLDLPGNYRPGGQEPSPVSPDDRPADDSPPPRLFAGLKALQGKETWRAARRKLMESWAAGSDNKALKDHLLYGFSSFGHKMWALSCRVIAKAYETYGSPMGQMETLKDPPLIQHVFSHPLDRPEYRQLHENFREKHPWFSYTDLKGKTHFPSLEVPDKVANQIEDLIKQATA